MLLLNPVKRRPSENIRADLSFPESSNRPGSKGFLVPDKSGRTNVLDRYLNEEFTIKLPSQKRVTDLKWFSVYDLTSQVRFA